MIHWTNLRAVAAGIAVLLLAQVVYLVELLHANNNGSVRLILLGFPAVAAFTTAYFSAQNKMAMGMSMAICGAVIGMASASVYEELGIHVDSIGSPIATFAILLAYDTLLSAVGSVVGYYLSRGKEPKPDKSMARGQQ